MEHLLRGVLADGARDTRRAGRHRAHLTLTLTLALTLTKARGLPTGDSLVEDDQLELASRLEVSAKAKGVELLLPVDYVVADRFEGGEHSAKVVSCTHYGCTYYGEHSAKVFTLTLTRALTLTMNLALALTLT